MQVIKHAGVESRMIILDDQACQKCLFASNSCMPDEARDGQNVALKWQLEVNNQSFVGMLDRPKQSSY